MSLKEIISSKERHIRKQAEIDIDEMKFLANFIVNHREYFDSGELYINFQNNEYLSDVEFNKVYNTFKDSMRSLNEYENNTHKGSFNLDYFKKIEFMERSENSRYHKLTEKGQNTLGVWKHITGL